VSAFTDAELDYLGGQPLGRLSTLGPDGAPQTRPVGFTLNRELDTIDIGGLDMANSRKYRNLRADPRLSFVVDDLASTDPWRPRGIEIRGTAELVTAAPLRGGFTGDLVRIRPARILAWGLDTNPFAPPNARAVGRPVTPEPDPAGQAGR
jgi:pyridoxamine 5'-phosphate oxidase family protein